MEQRQHRIHWRMGRCHPYSGQCLLSNDECNQPLYKTADLSNWQKQHLVITHDAGQQDANQHTKKQKKKRTKQAEPLWHRREEGEPNERAEEPRQNHKPTPQKPTAPGAAWVGGGSTMEGRKNRKPGAELTSGGQIDRRAHRLGKTTQTAFNLQCP